MHETTPDLDRLQSLLDESYRAAGPHLREVHTERVRLDARELRDALPWMQVFVVATVAGDGRPFTGPVDTFLHRGHLYFGTSPEALRARHLQRQPAISLTHARGEGLLVTAHGTAHPVRPADQDGFVDHLVEHYGPQWRDWGESGTYFVVEPTRLFAADMQRHQT